MEIKMVGRLIALYISLAFTSSAIFGVLSEDTGLMPRFIEDVPNITVTVGRDALLPCTVEQLKGYKVAWVQVDTQTILTIHKQVITRNPRISLLHNDHRTWHLQLRNVQESDRGYYMCQVNTDPMRHRQGYVDVVVPPDIIDRESSGDLTVREGQDVTLTCRARGHPTPKIAWRREDNQKIVLDSEKTGMDTTEGPPNKGRDEGRAYLEKEMAGVSNSITSSSNDGASLEGARVIEGETLVMKKVSRLQMASYLCIASNGIPPSISKRTHLMVQFPPMAWVPQQLEGAYVGQDLTIKCHTEAFPRSINYWTNTHGDMIVAGERYEPLVVERSYVVYMKLRIRRLEPQDFGTFHCVAKNSLGETDGAIKVYEIEPPKSQINPAGEEEEEEVFEAESSIAPSSTHQTFSNSGRKKYENYRHPNGINELTDQHRKSYDIKTLDRYNSGHYERRPSISRPEDLGSASKAVLASFALCTFSMAMAVFLARLCLSMY